MKIGIISDIHDNIWALAKVLQRLQDCDVLLVLGDLCSPFTVAEIAQGFPGEIHTVWGNNDGDRMLIVQVAAKSGRVHLRGEFAELELGGKRIAMTHYPHIANAVALGQQYQLVCYGHNHQRAITWQGHTLLVNPGEVMGRFGVSSAAVYDTDSGQAALIEM